MKAIPNRLNPGDIIEIISPSRWMNKEDLKNSTAVIEQMGFQTKIAAQNFIKLNQFAGSDYERAKAIEEAFQNPEVKAIICSKGGYGALRILEILNYDLIASNPKIFLGYSDITALLIGIQKNTELITFHGPMLHDFVGKTDSLTINCLKQVVCNPDPFEITFSENSSVRVMRRGMAEGEIFGGNLCVLTNLIGTPYDFDTAGKILFIEDIDEYLYSLDRMLLHLKRSGKLERITGLIVGEMIDLKDNDVPFGRNIDEMIMEICKDGKYPIISNFPCGHGESKLTIPISIKARIECNSDNISFCLLESSVL